MLAGFVGVMLGVGVMAMRDMGMVAGLFMISCGVMLGGGAMLFRGMLVMFCGFQMMFFTFFRYGALFLRLRDLGLRIASSYESAITDR
jgi:hypothetical protein